MDTEATTEHASGSATASTSAGLADTIRITRQGKLRVWVKRALDFFKANPDKPLVLYSSPSDVSTSTIPRLVSAVEIIKREYLKGLDISSGNLSGLHQYNQLLFEQRGEIPTDDSESRVNALLLALDGNSHPKQKLAPHMKITLSVQAIPERNEKRET
ncbi:hypothetical protein HYDPIDRAFT_26218 [Hydnomerulius pinastri MD-312]|nr:hypothetical protein HYDPIDRAFT_26218 [Hydnomerulius pinastri MD-312]